MMSQKELPEHWMCPHDDVIYGYIRGRDDKFSYPFPVWIAIKKCRKCGCRWVLKPGNMDFNSGYATWIPDNILKKWIEEMEEGH